MYTFAEGEAKIDMNLYQRFNELNIDIRYLDSKKQQTDYKIKYVSEYVRIWTIISAERREVKDINFIDCMCNAGVYADGDCCTAIEVLSIFIDAAGKHQEKNFHLYLNDYNQDKINILSRVVNLVYTIKLKNLMIHVDNDDVNDYLDDLKDNNEVFGIGKSTILYIDPFDFGTVVIPKVTEILKKNYCEVIFNFFSSDYSRNICQDKERIKKCIGGLEIKTKDEIIQYIKSHFKVGAMKYLFSYEFKSKKNVELYQIIFVTPSNKGLEKLKEVLWKVFDGKEFHRNSEETGQLSLFSTDDEKELRAQEYSTEAKRMLMKRYNGTIISYTTIEMYVIENTMLREGQIIKYVIKPLIDEGVLIKSGKTRTANNYKADTYAVGGKHG